MLLVCGAVAHAEGMPLELVWHAPPGCPTRAEIEAEVSHLLAPKQHFNAKLRAEARTELCAEGGFTLTLHTTQSGVAGERSFSSNSCRAVSDAAIVTMALSIDPTLELPRDFGNREQTAAPAPPAIAAPPSPKSQADKPAAQNSASSPQSSRRIELAHEPGPRVEPFARSLLGWRSGSLPKSTAELGLGLGVSRGRASIYTTLSLSPPTTAYSQKTPNAGGTFAMLAGEFAACGALLDRRLRLSPCIGVGYTQLFAKGIGVEPRRHGNLSWVSLLGGLQASYRQSRHVALLLGADVQVASNRPSAYLLDQNYPPGIDTIFRPDLLAYRLHAGVEFRLW
jgi:hypothetical protein